MIDKIFKFGQKHFRMTSRRMLSCEKKLNVVFFGTDLFSIKILSGLNQLCKDKILNQINVVTSASVSKKSSTESRDLTNFRGNQIIDFCRHNGIKFFTWNELLEENENLFTGFHVGIVASFGHLIPSNLILSFPYGIVNVHPSILPRWRGAAPLIYSVLFGDKEVGVSLMKIMPKHFDIGPIIEQKSTRIPPNFTSLMLLDYLGNMGNEMIIDLFKNFNEKINNIKDQSDENVCYAHKITSDMYFIDWANSTMSEIDCQHRALHEIKHLKSMFKGHVLKLYNMVNVNQKLTQHLESCEPGTVKFLKKENLIIIKCKDGFVGFRGILLNKKLSPKDFYNGYMNNRGLIKFDSVANTIRANIFKKKIEN